MKCPNCGAEVKEQDKVCQACNAPIDHEPVNEKASAEETGVKEAEAEEASVEETGVKEAKAEETSVEEAGVKEAKTEETNMGEIKEAAEGEAKTEGESAEVEVKAGEAAAEDVSEAGAAEKEAAVWNKKAAPKKGGKIAALAVAAAAVVGIGAFGMMKLQEKDPKEAVIDAFKSVYSEDQTYPINEIFGLSQFGESVEKSTESGFSLILDSCSEETVNNFAGSGLRIDARDDKENQKSAVDLAAVYNHMDLLTINVYFGDDKLMAAVPELLDTVFVADLGDGLEERLAASPTIGPALEAQGADIEGIVAYFKDVMDQAQENGASDPYDLKGLINRYKEGCKAQENFKAAMTVEKAGKAEFQMDGKAVSCKGYQVHISKDAMIDFLRTSSDFFLQDEQLKQAYLENLEASTKLMELFGTDYEGLSAEELQEQTYDEASKQIQDAVTELDKFLQDMDMMVYVDPKGRLAAVTGSTAIAVEGEDPQTITFEAYLEGGAYLTQNASASVTVDTKEEPVTVKLTKAGTWDGKQLTSSYEFHAQDAALILDGQYTVESGEYELKAEVRTDSVTQAKMSAAGVFDELEKGTSVHCSMDEISVEVVPEDFALTMSGEFYLRPLSGEIAEPEGEQLDVFAADESDWQGIALQAYFGAMGLMSKLGLGL